MQADRDRDRDRLDFARLENDPRWIVLGLTPFEQPDARLAIAFARGGGLALLDLGRDGAAAIAALRSCARQMPRGFGIRIPNGASASLELLNDGLAGDVRVVVVDGDDAPALAIASQF